MIMARALKVAQATIERHQQQLQLAQNTIQQQAPKVAFAKNLVENLCSSEKVYTFAVLRQGQHLYKVARNNANIKKFVKVSYVSNDIQQMAKALVLTAPTYGLLLFI